MIFDCYASETFAALRTKKKEEREKDRKKEREREKVQRYGLYLYLKLQKLNIPRDGTFPQKLLLLLLYRQEGNIKIKMFLLLRKWRPFSLDWKN